jgi:uncharacterized membrane protein
LNNLSGLRLKTSSQLRQGAWDRLRGKWLGAVIATVAMAAIGLAANFAPIITLLASGPLRAGYALYFLRIVRGGAPDVDTLFSGFHSFLRNLALFLLFTLYVFLWSLLLVVPGIVKALGYSMAWYIRNDEPGLSASQALQASAEMMRGHKLRLFWLSLSFVGWYLLSVLVVLFSPFLLASTNDPQTYVGYVNLFMGAVYLFINPYLEAAMAVFYQELRKY